MSIYSRIGVFVVLLALICYSIAILTEQKKRLILPKVVQFLTLGIIFDFVATVCMIIGSGKGFSLHGLIGYSSFLLMLIETIWVWKMKLKNGYNTQVTKLLHTYTLIAYVWWIAAFITGGLLVALKK